MEALRKIHMVLCERASRCNFSFSGMGVRPSPRVRIMVCTFSGMVNWDCKAAAAARKEEIPGVTPRIFLELTGKDGRPVRLIDYASAGKDYKTPIAAFLPLSGED